MLQSTHVVLMLFASGATALRLSRRGLTGIAAAALVAPNAAQAEMKKLSPIQFIAALGDKDASSGKGAAALHREDPALAFFKHAAGSALAQSEHAIGLACVGYTWGFVSSIAFGRHYGSFLSSKKPRLLITGDADEFTSEQTLSKYVAKAGPSCDSIVVRGVGHFELEAPHYDGAVAKYVLDWIEKVGLASGGGGGASSTCASSE